MDEGRRDLHKRILTNLLFSVVVLITVILIGPKLLQFFMPLIIAWIIASVANPMVVFLEQRIRIMRKTGSVLVIVFVLALVGGVFYTAIRFLVSQISSLLEELPVIYEKVISSLQEALVLLHEHLSFIPTELDRIINIDEEKIEDILLSFTDIINTGSVSAVGDFASSVIDVFILAVLTLMISYFFVARREQIKETFKRCTPQGIKDFWNMAMDTCLRALAGYLKACFQIMLVIFVILFIIFGGIMKVEYSSLLALLTAFLDFLPFLGTGIIITPWAIYCFIMGEYVNVLILVITYIICLVVHRLLEPKLVGDSVGMSPFATLISMFIGYRLIGMLGLILGIPVGMVVLALKEQGIFDSYIRGIKILLEDINEYRKY